MVECRAKNESRSPALEEEKTALEKAVSGSALPLCYRGLNGCWTEFSLFWGRFSRCRRGKSKNRLKNRIFGLVEPRSAVFRPYFHIFAVAEACSRPLRVICSNNWVSLSPSYIFRNPIISSSWVQRHGSGATHGRSVYLRSEGKRLHSDNLWVVAWNRLLDRIFFISWPFLRL